MAHKLGHNDGLADVQVAIQGLGSVGFDLARRPHDAGARLQVADINGEAIARAVDEFGAVPVDIHDVHGADVDVFAPCALGAVINDQSVGEIIEIAQESDFGGAHDDAAIFERLDQIHDTLLEIFERADTEGAATNFIADQMAEERIGAV